VGACKQPLERYGCAGCNPDSSLLPLLPLLLLLLLQT
jgi:hypothetical protein